MATVTDTRVSGGHRFLAQEFRHCVTFIVSCASCPKVSCSVFPSSLPQSLPLVHFLLPSFLSVSLNCGCLKSSPKTHHGIYFFLHCCPPLLNLPPSSFFLKRQLTSASMCQLLLLRLLLSTGQEPLPSCLWRCQTQLHSADWRDPVCCHCVRDAAPLRAPQPHGAAQGHGE